MTKYILLGLFILTIAGCAPEQKDSETPRCCNCTCETPESPVNLLTLVEGQKLTILRNQWLMRARANPKQDAEFGDSCLAEKGQKYLVLKLMGPLEALVRYESTGDEGGTTCEDGVLGVLDVKDLSAIYQESITLKKNQKRIEKWLATIPELPREDE